MVMVKRAGSSQAVSRSTISRSGRSSSRKSGSTSSPKPKKKIKIASAGASYSTPVTIPIAGQKMIPPQDKVKKISGQKMIPPPDKVKKKTTHSSAKADTKKFPTAKGGQMEGKHISRGTPPTEKQKAPLRGPAPGVIPWYVKKAQEEGNKKLLDRYAQESITSREYHAEKAGHEPVYTTALYNQMFKIDDTGTRGIDRIQSKGIKEVKKQSNTAKAKEVASISKSDDIVITDDFNPLSRFLRPASTPYTTGIHKPGVTPNPPQVIPVSTTPNKLLQKTINKAKELGKRLTQTTDPAIQQAIRLAQQGLATKQEYLSTLTQKQHPKVHATSPPVGVTRSELPPQAQDTLSIYGLARKAASAAVQVLAPGIEARISADRGSGWLER